MIDKIEIQYCSSWGYDKQAVGLAADILKQKRKDDLGQLILLPADGGRFEVTVDGKLIFSKVAEGRFPENEEILSKL